MHVITIAITIERKGVFEIDMEGMKRLLVREKMIRRADNVRFQLILGTIQELVEANNEKYVRHRLGATSIAADGRR